MPPVTQKFIVNIIQIVKIVKIVMMNNKIPIHLNKPIQFLINNKQIKDLTEIIIIWDNLNSL